MDKNTIVGFLLIALVLVGFGLFNRPSAEEQARMQRYQDSIHAVAQEQAAKRAAGLSLEPEIVRDSSSLFFDASQGQEDFVILKNNLVELTFTNKGARVYKALLFDYNGQDGLTLTIFDGNDSQTNYAFNGKNENIMTELYNFECVNGTDGTVTQRLTSGKVSYIYCN